LIKKYQEEIDCRFGEIEDKYNDGEISDEEYMVFDTRASLLEIVIKDLEEIGEDPRLLIPSHAKHINN